MCGGIRLTSLNSAHFPRPSARAAHNKESACVVNLWGWQPDCACGPGADDFPALLWGMTLTGQLGRLNGAQLHGWGTGRRRTQDFSAMASKTTWFMSVSLFVRVWRSWLKFKMTLSGHFFSFVPFYRLINYWKFTSPRRPGTLSQSIKLCVNLARNLRRERRWLVSY